MSKSIIVPLDGSPRAEQALPFALDLCVQPEDVLTFLAVVTRPEPLIGRTFGGPMRSSCVFRSEAIVREELEASSYLTELIATHHLEGRATPLVRVGEIDRQIQMVAAQCPQPICVLTQGPGVERGDFTSLASRLLRTSAFPMLVVPV